MRELFVYYRVHADAADAVRAMVRRLHASMLSQHPGLTARLLRRPEQVDGFETWMETYAMDAAHAPQGIGPALQAAIEAQAAPLLPLLHGPRHTEAFIACAS